MALFAGWYMIDEGPGTRRPCSFLRKQALVGSTWEEVVMRGGSGAVDPI